MTLAKQLKEAIRRSGQSVYRIAKESGVPQPTLARFAAGERDIVLRTAGKLADYLGLELTEKKGKVRK